MDRMPERPEADTDGGSILDPPLPLGAAARIARNRQAAAAYLWAATVTDDPAARQSLRRRAAELISPRRRASWAYETTTASGPRRRPGTWAQASCFQ